MPFKSKRPSLPDNYEQALQRAKKLRMNLKINPDIEKKFCAFMEKILENGLAELAPPFEGTRGAMVLTNIWCVSPEERQDQSGVRLVSKISGCFIERHFNVMSRTYKQSHWCPI